MHMIVYIMAHNLIISHIVNVIVPCQTQNLHKGGKLLFATFQIVFARLRAQKVAKDSKLVKTVQIEEQYVQLHYRTLQVACVSVSVKLIIIVVVTSHGVGNHIHNTKSVKV